MKVPVAAFMALGILLACINSASAADAYPTRPIRWIVPYPPGGTTDILARIMAQRLSERLGHQVLIDNRPGAGNNIGTELAIKSTPDGYTFFLVNPANAINATLYRNLNFNFLIDMAPVDLLHMLRPFFALAYADSLTSRRTGDGHGHQEAAGNEVGCSEEAGRGGHEGKGGRGHTRPAPARNEAAHIGEALTQIPDLVADCFVQTCRQHRYVFRPRRAQTELIAADGDQQRSV